ncbi:serine/threonine-protein kinase [Haliangium sp.]|uniref:serine/threonine-protein kinase n=1 Tax=Haliangium sp. TaxID=2663208 RepID=UPI003D0A6205
MTSQFGPYWMLRRIGHGDLAEVFVAVRAGDGDGAPGSARTRPPSQPPERAPTGDPLATDSGVHRPEKPLAVKRIWREMACYDEIHRLLREEGELALHFDHPNVVRVFDVGAVGGRAYIAMEYVPGGDLAHLVERVHPHRLTPGCVTRIGLDICRALAYIHDAPGRDGRPLHVIHGDLTPTNILVSTSGVAKLIDFSVATREAAPDPAPDRAGAGGADGADGTDGDGRDDPRGTVRGTYAYMSPEQARGEPLDRRTDVFALGVVLWEAFAGRRLFRRGANYLTLAAVVEDDAPALADLDLDLGEATSALDDILARALAKRREDRFESATALAEALGPVAERAGWDTRAWTLKTAVRTLLSERQRRASTR